MKRSEQWWLDQIAELGCAACYKEGNITPATIHHIRSMGGPAGGSNRGHGEFLVLPLCHYHHQGAVSIHATPTKFKMLYGTEVELFNQTLKRLAEKLSS